MVLQLSMPEIFKPVQGENGQVFHGDKFCLLRISHNIV